MKMIAKFAVLVCLVGLVRASGWHGADYSSNLVYSSSAGYGVGGYSGYVSPSYSAPVVAKTVYAAPVVTKAVVPAYSYAAYAPAISTVSRYQVHSSPVVKSYVAAPVVKSYVAAPVVAAPVVAAPIVKSYVAAPVVKSYVAAPVSSYSSYSSAHPVGIGYSGGYSTGYTSDYYGGHSGYGYGGYASKYLW